MASLFMTLDRKVILGNAASVSMSGDDLSWRYISKCYGILWFCNRLRQQLTASPKFKLNIPRPSAIRCDLRYDVSAI